MKTLRVVLVLFVLAAFLGASVVVSTAATVTPTLKTTPVGMKTPTVKPMPTKVANVTAVPSMAGAPAAKATATPMPTAKANATATPQPTVKPRKLMDLSPMKSTVKNMIKSLSSGNSPYAALNSQEGMAVKGKAAKIMQSTSNQMGQNSGKTSMGLSMPGMRALPKEMQNNGLLQRPSANIIGSIPAI